VRSIDCCVRASVAALARRHGGGEVGLHGAAEGVHDGVMDGNELGCQHGLERICGVGTGGLSHQLHGERFGLVNSEWDNHFLDLLESDPEALTDYSHDDYMERDGAESVEMIIWLAMGGSVDGSVKRVHHNYHAPLITGYRLLALEN
jgi:hypothetical protein